MKGIIARAAVAALLGLAASSLHAEDEAALTARQTANPQQQQLKAGAEKLKQGYSALAIRDFFDPVIAHYERAYAHSNKEVHTARSPAESLLYLVGDVAARGGGRRRRDVIVLDSTWSDAYLLKAYALVEMQRVKEAQAALRAALRLAPRNARYLSELAYTYQDQKNFRKALEIYREAEDAAKLTSPEDEKPQDIALALRGQGYSLTELGRLDESEALYKRCLEIDPDDAKAKSELDYIQGLRARQRGAAGP
jgi:tetratricopeptide (TPR) repeat protein